MNALRRLGGHLAGPAIGWGLAAVLWSSCSPPPRDVRTYEDEPLVGATIEYEVQHDDTWASIAESFFGDARHAERISHDNGFDVTTEPPLGREIEVRVSAEEMPQVRAIAEARGAYNAGVEAMHVEGREEQAREAFERALEVAPHFVDARYNLGLVLLKSGRPQEAVEHLRNVAEQRPADKDARYALAASYFHLGRYAQAAPELEAALALDPDFLRALFTYALALERMGREAEAQRAWRSYLERDATSAWAEEARQHLRDLGAR